MRNIKILLASLLVAAFAFQGCEDMDDNAVPVNDFIWKGLNLYYLYKDNVPNLSDDRFANQQQLNNFLQSYNDPEDLFESLLYREDTQGNDIDRFSVIVPDFRVLENTLQGITKSSGMEFGLLRVAEGSSDVFGYVRYVLPGSDAEAKGIQRGDIFYAVDGTQLTEQNYYGLLFTGSETFTLGMANLIDGTLTPNGEQVTITKTEISENPVYSVKVFNEGSRIIGYLMYNGFYSGYDGQLNAAFGELAAAGVTDLVLDLRYNSGGSVRTATYLASMITGQFTGELFAKEQWNSRLQEYYENNNPDALVNLFTDQIALPGGGTQAINHLNLSKVYILTTGTSASASELVINCLEPYIDVVTIGTKTTGKNVASVTLYDSPDFTANGRNGSHRYAMQPIVLKLVNADGFGEYTAGIAPDMQLREDYENLGKLGTAKEPYLAAAIAMITAKGMPPSNRGAKEYPAFKDSRNMRRFATDMYIDELPEGSLGLIKQLP